MADFERDAVTGTSTIWFMRGGQIARSVALNGATMNYDLHGHPISYVVPKGTINLANVPGNNDLRQQLKNCTGANTSN